MSLPTRLFAALPDTATAVFFLIVWFAPLQFGIGSVGNAMLIMLIEFILIHASAFFGSVAFASGGSRGKKILAILGFAGFYLLFVTAFALIFKAWWPFLAFAWLLAGKLWIAIDPRRSGPERAEGMQAQWGVTTVAYLAGVFLTVLVPMPRFGITPDVVAQLGLTGSGLWVEKPHTVIAFGAFYFSVLAWYRFRYGARVAGADRSRPTG